MKRGNINEDKSLVLKEADSTLNYDGKFNFYGSENRKMQVEEKCTSSYCPNNDAVVKVLFLCYYLIKQINSKIVILFPVPRYF